MDIQSLTATQLAYVIRLSVFMDNHQTQGIRLNDSIKVVPKNIDCDVYLWLVST